MNIQSFKGYVPHRSIQSSNNKRCETNRPMSKNISFKASRVHFNANEALNHITTYAEANKLSKELESKMKESIFELVNKGKKTVVMDDPFALYFSFEHPTKSSLEFVAEYGNKFSRKCAPKRTSILFPEVKQASDVEKPLNKLDDILKWQEDIDKHTSQCESSQCESSQCERPDQEFDDLIDLCISEAWTSFKNIPKKLIGALKKK